MIRGSGIINNTVRRAVATEAVGRTRPALAPFLGGANPAAAASVSRVAEPICGFSGAKLAVTPKLSVGANVGTNASTNDSTNDSTDVSTNVGNGHDCHDDHDGHDGQDFEQKGKAKYDENDFRRSATLPS